MALCKSLLLWGIAPAMSAASLGTGLLHAVCLAQSPSDVRPPQPAPIAVVAVDPHIADPSAVTVASASRVGEAPALPSFSPLPPVEMAIPWSTQAPRPIESPRRIESLQSSEFLRFAEPLRSGEIPSFRGVSTSAEKAVGARAVSVEPVSMVRPLPMPQSAGGPVLDTQSMTSKTLDGSVIFSGLRSQLPNLQIEGRFFESATIAETPRTQRFDGRWIEWDATSYCWQSPAFCHSPLYFEQTNLERYGQGKNRPWTPAVSAAHFVSHVTTLPIALFCAPPWTKSCTLGHHRPGNGAPFQWRSEHR